MSLDERPVSPTQAAKVRAAEGAAAAGAAARAAEILNWRTRRNNDGKELYNSKVPRVPLSDSAFDTERQRTAPPVAVALSRYCRDDELSASSPAVHTVGDTANLLSSGLGQRVNTVKLHTQLTSTEAAAIIDMLADPICSIRQLGLASALVQPIEPTPEAVARCITTLREEFPEGSEETAEKLQAAVEKQKGEFTNYAKGIEYLATKRADPLRVLFQTIGNDNTSLRELRLNGNEFGAPNGEGRSQYQPLRRLAKLIDANEHIRVLDLAANRMGPVGVGIVAKALTKNIAIHSLDLSGNDVAGEAPEEDEDPEVEEEDPVFGEVLQGLEALSEVIKKNKFLRKISLRHNRLKAEIDEAGDDDGVETPLGKFLEPFKKYHRLQVLDLSCNELAAAGARMVAAALIPNKAIVVLDLSNNNLAPKGLIHVANLVSKSTTLQSLVLDKNDLSGKKGKRAQKEAHDAMLKFASALAQSASLTSLSIAGNHLGPELAADLLATLSDTLLTSLNLDSNELCGAHVGEFDDRAIRCLASAVGSATCTMKSLSLAGNYVQPQGIAALLEGGQHSLSSVTELNLSRNALGDEGIAVLATRIPFLFSLTTLNLAHNRIHDPTPLTLALRTNPTVRHLLLGHNNIGDAKNPQSLVDLVDVIGNKPQFETIDLCHNELTDEHAKVIAYLCHTATPPLKSLFVDGNPAISIDETIKMIQALGRNTSIRFFKASAQEGDHLPVLQAIQQTLIQNKTLEEVDVGLSLEISDEQQLIAEIKAQLLQNALNAGVASMQSTFQAL